MEERSQVFTWCDVLTQTEKASAASFAGSRRRENEFQAEVINVKHGATDRVGYSFVLERVGCDEALTHKNFEQYGDFVPVWHWCIHLNRINCAWFIWSSVIRLSFAKTWHGNIGIFPMEPCDVCLCVWSSGFFLLCLNPNWLSISGFQESSDSSNTTVEDEDVKGKIWNLINSKALNIPEHSRIFF